MSFYGPRQSQNDSFYGPRPGAATVAPYKITGNVVTPRNDAGTQRQRNAQAEVKRQIKQEARDEGYIGQLWSWITGSKPEKPKVYTDTELATRQKQLKTQQEAAIKEAAEFKRQADIAKRTMGRAGANLYIINNNSANIKLKEAQAYAAELEHISRTGVAAPKVNYFREITGAIPRSVVDTTFTLPGLAGEFLGRGVSAGAEGLNKLTGGKSEVLSDIQRFGQYGRDLGIAQQEWAKQGSRNVFGAPSQGLQYDPTAQLAVDVSGGVGSLVPFLGPARAARMFGVGADLAAAQRAEAIAKAARPYEYGLGIGQGAQQGSEDIRAYEQRTNKKVSDANAFAAILLNAGLGATEVGVARRLFETIPVARRGAALDAVSNTVRRATSGRIDPTQIAKEVGETLTRIESRAPGRIAVRGAEEALQEGGVQLGTNLIAQQLYDENRNPWEGVGRSALVGGIVGGGVRTATEGFDYLGRRAAANKFKADALAGQERTGTYTISTVNKDDPTQTTEETVYTRGFPDKDGNVVVEMADGSLKQMPLQDIEARRVDTGTRKVPETFSRPVVAERLAASLGNTTPDEGLTTYIDTVNKRLTDAMAKRDPAAAETYLDEQLKSLKKARLPEETKIARMLVLDEARNVHNEFLDSMTAPEGPVPVAGRTFRSETPGLQPGQEQAGSERFTTPTPPKTIAEELAEQAQERQSEQQKRMQLLEMTLEAPVSDHLSAFENLMTLHGFTPNAAEIEYIQDWMREQSEAETQTGQERTEELSAQEQERSNIVEATLRRRNFDTETKISKINADLMRAGQEPLTDAEIERIQKVGTAADVFGSKGEFERRDEASVAEEEPLTEEDQAPVEEPPVEEDQAPEEDFFEEEDFDEHPIMQEHDAQYDDALEAAQNAENMKEFRNLMKEYQKEGLIDEDDVAEINDRLQGIPNAEKLDEALAALDDALNNQRDNRREDVIERIREEQDTEQAAPTTQEEQQAEQAAPTAQEEQQAEQAGTIPLTPYEDVGMSIVYYRDGSQKLEVGAQKSGWIPPNDDRNRTLEAYSPGFHYQGLRDQNKDGVEVANATLPSGENVTIVSVLVPSIDETYGDRGNHAAVSFWFRGVYPADMASVIETAQTVVKWIADPNNSKKSDGPLNGIANKAIAYVANNGGQKPSGSTSYTSARLGLSTPETISASSIQDAATEIQRRLNDGQTHIQVALDENAAPVAEEAAPVDLAQEIEQAYANDEINEKAYNTLAQAVADGKDPAQIADRLESARSKHAEDIISNRYRRAEEGKPEQAVPTADVEEHIAKLTEGWNANFDVKVVDSLGALPASLRDAIIKDNAQNAVGFVSPDGTVYVLAQNLSSLTEATGTLYHEALGHLGLRKLFNERLDGALRQILTSNEQLRNAAKAWIKANPGAYKGKDRFIRALEEVLAERSEGGRINASAMAKLGAVFKEFGRKIGLKLKYTDSEVSTLLAMAHDQIINGNRESGVVKGLRYMIKVWHGSPHDFDKFTTEKIGTGEGAQAYGWGLYFSSNKGIAQGYRDRLSKGRIAIDTPDGPQSERDFNTAALVEHMGFPPPDRGVQNPRYPAIWALDQIVQQGGNLDAIIKEMREEAYPHFPKEALDQAEAALRAANPRVVNKGKLYEVTLAPSENELLDLDTPLSEQPKKVQDALADLGISTANEDVDALTKQWHSLNVQYDNVHAERAALIRSMGIEEPYLLRRSQLNDLITQDSTGKLQALSDRLKEIHAQTREINSRIVNADPDGKSVYRDLRDRLGSPKAASQALLLAGVRGLKYVGDSSGITNYVVFGDSDITINNKYKRTAAPPLPGGNPPSPSQPSIETLGFSADLQGRVKRMKSNIIRKINYKYQGAVDYSRALAAVYGVTKLPDNMNVANKFALLESRKIGSQMSLKRWYLDPLEEMVKDLELDPQDVGMYLWARGAKDRNAIVRKRTDGKTIDGSGMTDADAQGVIDHFLREGLLPKLKKVAKLHDSLVDYMGNERVKAGMISKEEWKRLRDEQPFYAPLKGAAFEGDMNEDGDPKKAMAEAREEYQKMGGRTRISEFLTSRGRKDMPFNPLFTVMADAQAAIARIERNRVAQTLLDNALDDPELHKGVVKVYSEKKVPGATMLSGQALTKMRERASDGSRVGDRAFVVKKGGDAFYLDFQNTEAGNVLYRAFSNMTPKELGAFMTGGDITIAGKTIHIPGVMQVSNGIKSLKTRFNPSYLLGTAWQRDFQEAILTNLAAQSAKGGPAEGKKIAAKSTKYMFDMRQATVVGNYLAGRDMQSEKNTELTLLFDQFLKDGGAVGNAMIESAQDRVKTFSKALGVVQQLQNKRPDLAALEMANAGLEFLDAVAQIMDMQARFATYRAALDAKIDRDGAAMLALDSSLNLTRRGELAPYLDTWFFFWSAGIEGGRKFIKQGLTMRNARWTIAAAFKIGILLQLWNSFMSDDDDEDGRKNILDVSDTTRQTRGVVYIPEWLGGTGKTNDYVSIPTAFSLGFAKYAGEQFMQAMQGDITAGEAGVTIANAFREMALPVRGSASKDWVHTALSVFLPDVTQPFIDVEANANYFGSPIYRENKFDEGPRSGLGREDTPAIWKWLAEGANSITGGTSTVPGGFSRQPEWFEYLATQYGGGLFDVGAKGLQGKMPDFFKLSGKGGEFAPMNNFYKNTENMDQIYKSYNDAEDDNDPALVENRRKFPVQGDEEVLDAYDVARDELKDIRKDYREGGYDSIEEYHKDMNEVYKAFNRIFNEAKKRHQESK